MTYCTDIDLLHYEPNIFRDAAFASQLLMGGTGNLAGTAFTIASGSFTAEHVAAGHVLALEGVVAGCYPIVSVDSATQLTVSVMHPGLFPESGSGVASPVGAATGVTFAVRTFWPQREVVSALLERAAGIGPEAVGQEMAEAEVLNTSALKRACALGTLQMIYSALAAAAADPSNLTVRAEMYERMYRRALSGARVEIDVDGDGVGDVTRVLSVVELKRV
jgi:hypothetical protein